MIKLNELPYTMEDIKRLYSSKKYFLRQHMLDKMHEREITMSELSQTLQSGEIIERYPEDKPFPSCLVIGFTVGKRPIHVVCSVDAESDMLYLITTYEPDKVKWNFNFRQPLKT